jgi:hypothetical protein
LIATAAAVAGESQFSSTNHRATPVKTQDILDSFGVQVHQNYHGSVYDNSEVVLRLLEELGVRHTRDRLAVYSSASMEFHQRAARLGIKQHAVCGALETTGDEERLAISTYVAARPWVFDSLEGFNEPNAPGRPTDWAQRTVSHQLWLAALCRRTGLPACSPALFDQGPTLAGDYERLAEAGIATHFDVINIHRYPGGEKPSTLIDERSSMAREAWGELPVWCSEGGYFTAPEYEGGATPVPAEVQAVYGPRHLMEWVSRSGRFWQYELLDDVDATGAEREAHLGMVETPSADPATWVKKPVFEEMSALLTDMSDANAGSFTPRAVEVEISAPVPVRWVLGQRSEGNYRLYLWRDVSVYDESTTSSVRVDPATVSVRVGSKRRTAHVGGALVTVSFPAP